MPATLNQYTAIGNLTRDPELRVTPKGKSITSFSIAINRTYKDESGASHDEVTYINCEAWAKQGELVAKYCSRGSAVCIVGRFKTNQWEDSTTKQKRSALVCVVNDVQFLGGGKNNAAQGQQATGPGAGSNAPADDHVDEDVPF